MQGNCDRAPYLSLTPTKCMILASVILLTAISFFAPNLIKDGMSMCVKSVIPSVFPFLIISSLITLGGLHNDIGAFFLPPLRRAFGCDRSGACAIALGFLCGYPVGLSVILEAYDRGEISSRELEKYLCIINNPSPAFVIGGVGGSLLASRRTGIAIYVCVIISAALVGVFLRPFSKDATTRVPLATKKVSLTSSSFSHIIAEAISNAASTMVSICAFIITFYSISAMICQLIPQLSQYPRIFICGALEISSGARAAAELSGDLLPHMLCASICSWSGLSIHMQILYICRGRKISFKKFALSKVAQALLSPIILYLYFIIICPLLPHSASEIPSCSRPALSAAYILILILASLLLLLPAKTIRRSVKRTK